MQDTTIKCAAAPDPADVKPARAAAGAALLCVLSMSSVQFGAALSEPPMSVYGSLSTTWLRLCWAALVLAVLVRPRVRSYSRAHWFAAGALGAAMAGMTLCFFAALQRITLGLAVVFVFLALAAACGWGSYIVLMKKTGKLFAGLEGLSVSLIAAALVATPFGLAQNGIHVAAGQLAATAGLAILDPLLPY